MEKQKENNFKRKEEKGITLIALVITIVILIILATVTLNVVLGEGGLIQRAQEAKEMTEEAARKEQQAIDNLTKQIDWDSSIVYPKEDEQGNLIPIPNGYYYVEGTKDTGFVISDSKTDENNPSSYDGNQFVWVPVDDINEYTLTSWNGEQVSEEQAENSYYFKQQTTSLQNSRINSGKDDTEGETEDDTGGLIIIEINEDESIEKYGGFYIGRFEASYNSETRKKETKKDKVPYTNVSYADASSEILQSLGKVKEESDQPKIETVALHVNTNVSSLNGNNIYVDNVVTGRQWDAMIRWINKTTNNTYNNSGHTGTSKINTGSNDSYKINNIYDISGNVAEWTKEWYGSEANNVVRGGSYNQTDIKANKREHNDGTASEQIGFRQYILIPTEIQRSNAELEQGGQNPGEGVEL